MTAAHDTATAIRQYYRTATITTTTPTPDPITGATLLFREPQDDDYDIDTEHVTLQPFVRYPVTNNTITSPHARR